MFVGDWRLGARCLCLKAMPCHAMPSKHTYHHIHTDRASRALATSSVNSTRIHCTDCRISTDSSCIWCKAATVACSSDFVFSASAAAACEHEWSDCQRPIAATARFAYRKRLLKLLLLQVGLSQIPGQRWRRWWTWARRLLWEAMAVRRSATMDLHSASDRSASVRWASASASRF